MQRAWSLLLLLLLAGRVLAEPLFLSVTVDGIERTALVYPGEHAGTTPSPVVLAFHGFGSSAVSMARTLLHEAYPEATVVYPEGLKIHSDRLGRDAAAWQAAPGRDHDRDIHFVEALLAELHATVRVDDRRIYVTGLSNGALFTYCLLVMRPKLFAAFAGVAGAVEFVSDAHVPRPVLLIQGKDDHVVKPEAAAHTRDLLRKLNGCGETTIEWRPAYYSYSPCTTGQPVIWRLHSGGHTWPREATRHVVQFFQEQKLPEP